MKQRRRNQKVIRIENDELDVSLYQNKKLKKKQQRKIDLEYPSCKQIRFIEFDKGCFWKNYEFKVNN